MGSCTGTGTGAGTDRYTTNKVPPFFRLSERKLGKGRHKRENCMENCIMCGWPFVHRSRVCEWDTRGGGHANGTVLVRLVGGGCEVQNILGLRTPESIHSPQTRLYVHQLYSLEYAHTAAGLCKSVAFIW